MLGIVAYWLIIVLMTLIFTLVFLRILYPIAYLEWLQGNAQRLILVIRSFKAIVREHIKSQCTSDEWQQIKHQFDESWN